MSHSQELWLCFGSFSTTDRVIRIWRQMTHVRVLLVEGKCIADSRHELADCIEHLDLSVLVDEVLGCCTRDHAVFTLHHWWLVELFINCVYSAQLLLQAVHLSNTLVVVNLQSSPDWLEALDEEFVVLVLGSLQVIGKPSERWKGVANDALYLAYINLLAAEQDHVPKLGCDK